MSELKRLLSEGRTVLHHRHLELDEGYSGEDLVFWSEGDGWFRQGIGVQKLEYRLAAVLDLLADDFRWAMKWLKWIPNDKMLNWLNWQFLFVDACRSMNLCLWGSVAEVRSWTSVWTWTDENRTEVQSRVQIFCWTERWVRLWVQAEPGSTERVRTWFKLDFSLHFVHCLA